MSREAEGKENPGYFVQGIQDIFHGLTEGFGAVWDHLSIIPSPSSVKYTGNSKLGYPRIINCEHTRLEMKEAGELVLNPNDSAIVKVAGTLFSTQPFFLHSLLRCGKADSAPGV